MTKLLPYFRWFPADAESDDKYSAMTDEQLGFFHRCLNKSWTNEGLPSDAIRRAQVMRTAPAIANRLWVESCWVESASDPSKVVNPRQELERSHAKKKSVRATEAVRSRYGRISNVTTDDMPRVYDSESESVSVFESSEEKRKERIVKALVVGIEIEELEKAHERHFKQRAGHSLQMAAQIIVGLNGKFDLVKFRERHPRYCEYWDRKDWKFCPLSLVEYIENGMPLPPIETGNKAISRQDEIEQAMIAGRKSNAF